MTEPFRHPWGPWLVHPIVVRKAMASFPTPHPPPGYAAQGVLFETSGSRRQPAALWDHLLVWTAAHSVPPGIPRESVSADVLRAGWGEALRV